MRHRTHLLIKGGRVACEQRVIYSGSKVPSEVTCGKCQHTIAMADAEARLSIERRREHT